MDKKLIALISVILIIIIGAFSFLIYSGSKKEKSEIAVKKPINANSATLISQENNVFKIKLDFKGDDKAPKSIVRYYVSLYRANDSKEMLPTSPIDIAKYDDIVVLGSGDAGDEREVQYSAPDYLKGKYGIVVDYVNEIGVNKGSMALGVFDLNGSYADFLEILPETCSLHIAGEAENKSYTIVQGVDVKSNEDLIATCSIRNHFWKDITTVPKVVNFRRKNFYPEDAVEQEKKTIEPVTFGANEIKQISFSIPKALNPQAYDAALYFFDDHKNRISTKTFFHYVLAGESANINAVALDKRNYASGDSANASLSYFGSADGFSDSRLGGTKNGKMTFELDLMNDKEESCLSEKRFFNTDPSDGKDERSFVLDVKKECKDASVKVIIRGEGGNILEKGIFLGTK
jgi:hypothetical protein